MIVEFAGLPGSGKSMLRSALLTRLTGAGLAVASTGRTERTTPVRATAELVRHYEVLAVVTQALRRDTRPLAEKVLALRLLAVALDEDRCCRREDSDDDRLRVLDEGLVQRGFTVFTGSRPPSMQRVHRYAKAIPIPDVLVAVDMSPAEAIAHAAGRDRDLPSRLSRMSEGQRLVAMAGGRAVLHLLWDALARRGTSVVTVQDAEAGAVGEAFDHIARLATSRLGTTSDLAADGPTSRRPGASGR